MAARKVKFNPKKHYEEHLSHLWRRAPFILRITEWKKYSVPVMVVKERYELSNGHRELQSGETGNLFPESKGTLIERGHLAGESQRRCIPILRRVLEPVTDEAGVPLELQRYLTRDALKLRLNLPLNEEAGAKLGLIFRLQMRINDIDRVELIVRRVANFSREEAVYWLSRTTSYGEDANRWAVSGLRILLGGQPQDQGVERMLNRLRDTA